MADSVHRLIQLKAHGGKYTPEAMRFLTDPEPEVRKEALAHLDGIPSSVLKDLLQDDHREVVLQALHHPDLFEPHLVHALRSEDPVIHAAVAGHPKINKTILKKILDHGAIPLETKRLAVANSAHQNDTLVDVLHRSTLPDNEDDRQLALEALMHQNLHDGHRVSFLKQSDDHRHKKLAASSIRSHANILTLLNDESVPMPVKHVLLRNKNFDLDNAWRITDPALREIAKEVNHEQSE